MTQNYNARGIVNCRQNFRGISTRQILQHNNNYNYKLAKKNKLTFREILYICSILH